MVLEDAKARALAIDPNCSSIVEAPAGSGKTTLLVARVLNLLALGCHPSSLLVLTFTNKAATQMAQRIAFNLKLDTPIAKKILTLSRRFNWKLEEDLTKVLRIQTIDAFSAYLVSKLWPEAMPKRIVDGLEAEFFYELAVKRFLEDFKTTKELKALLMVADFNYEKLLNSLKHMLIRRDCWLGFLLNLDEAVLAETIEQELITLNKAYLEEVKFPQDLFKSWQQLYLANSAFLDDENEVVTAFLKAPTFQALTINEAKMVANWLLTKDGTWRQQLTLKQGIKPVAKLLNKKSDLTTKFKRFKADLISLLQQISAAEPLRLQLLKLQQVPDVIFSKAQQEVLSAILKLLPGLLASLKLVWQEYKLMDYTELTVLASFTIDPELNEHSTEELFSKKARWKHLLVDEFQDTSLLHFNLLNKLTEDWSEIENNTIFLVGDPMQSIYRFRQAEVGLFLKAQQEGLGGLKLTNLTLTSNFRSAPQLVAWTNEHLKGLFPKLEDMNLGAVKFTASSAASSANFSRVEIITASSYLELQLEAVKLIKQLQQQNLDHSIAVLALNRAKLIPLAEALTSENVAFEAIELRRLYTSSLAKKLFTLMRLSLEPAKRSSWIHLWLVFFGALPSFSWLNLASKDLENFCAVLKEVADKDARLLKWVAGLEDLLDDNGSVMTDRYQLWLKLLNNFKLVNFNEPSSIAILNKFQELWEMVDAGADFKVLEAKFLEMYLPQTSTIATNLSLMTIHKAKGLEFDEVILMELNATGRSDTLPLILWQAQLYTKHQGLLLASRLTSKADLDLYCYLNNVEHQKTRLEQSRVFYVAATRARRGLYLLATQPVQPNSLWQLYCTANEVNEAK